MKKDIAWTLLAVVSFASGMILPYLEGRSNEWWAIPPLLPADILPALALLISCIALLGSWTRSFFPPAQPEPPVLFFAEDEIGEPAEPEPPDRPTPPVRPGRHRLAKGLMFLFSALLLVGKFRFLPAPVEYFHRGFNHYARTILTPDEWRQIARYAQAHPIPVKETPGLSIQFPAEEDIKALDAALRAATPFRKLPRYTKVWANADETDIYWGGALTGHRYVIVMNYPGSEKGDTKFVAEDIVTWMERD